MPFRLLKNAGLLMLALTMIGVVAAAIHHNHQTHRVLSRLIEEEVPLQLRNLQIKGWMESVHQRMLRYIRRERLDAEDLRRVSDLVLEAAARLRLRTAEAGLEQQPDTRTTMAVAAAVEAYLEAEANGGGITRLRVLAEEVDAALARLDRAFAELRSRAPASPDPIAMQAETDASRRLVVLARDQFARYLDRDRVDVDRILSDLTRAIEATELLYDGNTVAESDGRAEADDEASVLPILRRYRTIILDYLDEEALGVGNSNFVETETTLIEAVQDANAVFDRLTYLFNSELRNRRLAAEARVQSRQRVFVWLASLGSLLTLLMAWILDRAVSRRLGGLLDGTVKLAEGDLEYRLREGIDDAFGRLARAFNRMADALEKKSRELKQNLVELRRQKGFFETIFHHVPEGLVIADRSSRITMCNPGITRLFGYDAGELEGMDARELLGVENMHGRRAHAPVVSWERAGAAIGHCRRRDGSTFPAESDGTVIRDRDGNEIGYLGLVRDISDRQRSEQEIRRLAYYDLLTGLPNRTFLGEYLEQAIARARTRDHALAALCFDLDRFKRINDTFGHGTGDKLLCAVAERIRDCIRSQDVASMHACPAGQGVPDRDADGLFARFGGDEFVVVLCGLREATDAARVAKRINDALSKPFEIEARDLVVTASIGISIFPDDAHNPEELMRNADAAMYHAKEKGRATYEFYTESLNAAVFQRLSMEASLREALRRNEFVLHYQPKLGVRTNCVEGLEALVRWAHPDWGMVPPGQFIPIAEDSGLIVSLGEWIFGAACAQLREWIDSGREVVPISVNLSAGQLRSEHLVRDLVSTLERFEVDPAHLELELTESMLVQDTEQTHRLLTRIRALGIRISIDDFGTGYSSLSYLKRLPIDTLKVDRSFVRDITTDADSRAITDAIISMARSLRLEVVAEGVETAEQRAYLESKGCDLIQGYLVSPPVDAAEVAKFLSTSSDASAALAR